MLGGCAAAPSQQEVTAADYGNFPSDYEAIITKYMFIHLKDPASAQYQFLNKPTAAWRTLGGKKFGYALCAHINAKNSFGGYTGAKLYYFMIRNGVVIAQEGGDSDISQAMAEGACKPFI